MATLTGKQFFPYLIAGPFHHGLVIVFGMAIIVLIIAAGTSLLRGGRYVHDEHASGQDNAAPGDTVAEDPGPLADTALGASPDLASRWPPRSPTKPPATPAVNPARPPGPRRTGAPAHR